MSSIKKKAGHYRKEEKKTKNQREVLSYEQLPLDEYEKQEKSSVVIDKKKVIIAIVILVVLVLSVVLYFTGGSITSCTGTTGTKQTFTSTVIGSSIDAGNFRVLSDGVCYMSDTDFVSLSSSGEQLFSEQHGLAHPILKTKGSKALAYDLGSNTISIYSASGKEYTFESENAIYLADITSGGTYALVTEAMGYNAKLSVYAADNTIKYAYSFADYYITSMALNSGGTGAVVCGVSADEGTTVSAVYVLDFTKEEPVAKHLVSGDMIFDCDYLSGSSVCVVGSSATYICNGSDFGRIQKNSYNQMTLTAYDINSDVGVAVVSLSRSGDGRNCNLEYINSSGTIEKTIETEMAVSSVSAFKDRVAVSSAMNISLYRSNGSLVSTYETESTNKQVRLYSSSGVYILGLDQIIGITL